MEKHKIIIAGPCALESKEQLIACLQHLGMLGIRIIRASLWKPRTLPGWDGWGEDGLSLLLEETLSRGMIPATEILTAIHAQMVVDALKYCGIKKAGMLVWIGARNQNHFELRKICNILADGPDELLLMFKNQMWVDKDHWFGIYQHIAHTGFPTGRLLACHRGFNCGFGENPENLRNIPTFDWAMEMREKMKIPMILDPSHIAGSREKIFPILKQSLDYEFDGFMIEVHPDFNQARTDNRQQVSFAQFEQLLEMIDLSDANKLSA